MGTRAALQAYLDQQDGHVGGEKYWQYVYGWSGGGAPYCVVGMDAAFKATNTKCNYFPATVAFDNRDRGVIGSAYRGRWNLEWLDAISFDWDGDGGGDHVGFFIRYLGNGMCRTFEFNVSNTAGYRTRYVSQIICGIRPQYDEEKEEEVYSFATIKKGSYGDAVGMMQAALNIRNGANIKLDKDFGPYTDKKLREFQKKVGIGVDGVCGHITWGKLLGK